MEDQTENEVARQHQPLHTYSFTGGDKGTWKPVASAGFEPIDGFVVLRGVWMEHTIYGHMVSYRPETGEGWERKYTDIFGKGTTPDDGWWWRVPDDEELPIIGYSSSPWAGSDKNRTTLLTGKRMVGLDRDTGKTLWSVSGAEPCDQAADTDTEGKTVVCRYRAGTLKVKESDGERVPTWKGVNLQLVKLDLTDGSTDWELDLGGESANYQWQGRGGLYYAHGDQTVVVQDDRAVRISQATGKATALPDDAVLLCNRSYTSVPQRSAWTGGQLLEDHYSTLDKYQRCSPDGEVGIQGDLTYGTLQVAGYDTTEISVVADGPGLVAYEPL